jgi:hypothetical protein
MENQCCETSNARTLRSIPTPDRTQSWWWGASFAAFDFFTLQKMPKDVWGWNRTFTGLAWSEGVWAFSSSNKVIYHQNVKQCEIVGNKWKTCSISSQQS